MPFLLPRILSWGGLLLADWSSPGMACVTLVLRLCRSFRGHATFGEATIGKVLSSLPGSSSPRWSRQPAAGAAGPLARAGLLYLAPWRFLGRQPADISTLGIPLKSSPRQSSKFLGNLLPGRPETRPPTTGHSLCVGVAWCRLCCRQRRLGWKLTGLWRRSSRGFGRRKKERSRCPAAGSTARL
jgi:hypothetical protein